MLRKFLCTFVVILIISGNFLFSAEKTNLELKKYAKERNIFIGCAVMPEYLNDPAYVKILTNNFNYITPENNMKWGLIHPTKNGYDFSGADRIVNFALKNGMRLRGHTLAWHYQNPPWLNASNLSKEKAMELLKDHIKNVVGRYKGKVKDWDVVNEPIDDSGNMRANIWYLTIGKDYIELALRWVNEIDPEAKLFLNDYNIEEIGMKSDAFYNLVKKLKESGVPIHGVGFQFHLNGSYYPDFSSIAKNIKRFKEIGLEVHFTEIDVRINGKPTEKEINQHKKIYSELIRLALAYNCEAFITWGLSDRHSWIPFFFPGYGYGLMFDENYNPKPAAFAVRDVLMEGKPVPADFEKTGAGN
ncbi:MAG: endo-1,4-beta-xylanase [Brevinematia bacterium]